MKYLLFWLFIFSIVQAQAQWLPVEGIYGAACGDLIVSDSDVYLSAQGLGVLRQKKNEHSWQLVNNVSSTGLIVADDKIICKPDYKELHNLIRSLNKGLTWETLHFDTIQFRFITNVGNSLYAADYLGFEQYRFLKSEDYGTNWQIVNMLHSGPCWMMTSDQENLYLYYTDSVTHVLIFNPELQSLDSLVSTDNMLDMQSVDNGYIGIKGNHLASSKRFLYYNPQTQSVIEKNDDHGIYNIVKIASDYFGLSEFGVFRYNTTDSSWIESNSGIGNQIVWSIAENCGKYYISTVNGCYTSDSTFQWIENNNGLNGAVINDIKTRDNEVWVCTSFGLYKSVDKGAHFQKILDGFYIKIMLSESAIYVCGSKTFLVSEDAGNTWNNIVLPLLNAWEEVVDADFGGGYAYIITCCEQGNKMHRFKMNSKHWDEIEGTDIDFVFYVSASDSLVVLSCTSSSMITYPIYISSHFGTGIQPITLFQDSYYPFSAIKNGRIFVWFNSVLNYSDDGAKTWHLANLNGVNYLSDIDYSDNKMVVATFSIEPKPAFFVSNDNGNSFKDVTENLANPLSQWPNAVARHGKRIFVSVYRQGLWYRDDLMSNDESNQTLDENQLIVIPNPNEGAFTIKTENELDVSGILRILDSQGRTIQKQQITLCNGISSILIENEIPCGIYLLQLDLENDQHYWSKVVINSGKF